MIAAKRYAPSIYIANALGRSFKQNWVWLFVIVSIILLLQTILFLSNEAKGDYLINEQAYYIQKDNSLIFDQIYQLPEEQWLRPESLYFKNIDGKVWLRLAMPSLHESDELLLKLKDPLLDKVNIKLVQHKGNDYKLIKEYEMGDTLAFSKRAFLLPHFVVPVSANQESTYLYISATSKLSINLDYGLWNSQDFIEFNNHLTIFFGTVFGYILALVCYSLMMFATARRNEFMWYGLYLGAFLIHVLSLSGFGYQYIWPKSVEFQSVVGGISISLTYLCLVKFTQIIAKKCERIFQLLFTGLIYLFAGLCAWSLISTDPSTVKYHLLLIMLTSILMPVACYVMAKSGSKIGGLLSLVWSMLTLTASLSILNRYNIIQWQIDPLYILYFGFHIMSLVVGGALIYGYRVSYSQTIKHKEAALHDKELAVKAKDEILKIQEDAQYQLEQQVKAQTMQLENALAELSNASNELTQLRNQDSLTGLPNRLAFDEALFAISKRSIELGKSLCVAVLDIDHFKKVNDTYGHMAGDECLRDFSAIFKEHFASRDYCFCRFGGEEFIVVTMLPVELVEKEVNLFKEKVQANETITAGKHIRFTTSAGIACKRLINESDARNLISLADDNLYIAKQKGRNLVVA